MAFTLCTSGAATAKAGVNVSTTIKADATALDNYSDQAEGEIVTKTRKNYVTQFANLSTAVKGILNDISSSLIAMKMINFDMSGYTSKREAETMLDVNDEIVSKGITFLSKFKDDIKNP